MTDSTTPWPLIGRPTPHAPVDTAPLDIAPPVADPVEGSTAGSAPDAPLDADPRANPMRIALTLMVVAFGFATLGVYALAVIGALIVSVMLHEAGHYFVAKACGMKATEFFVGFGPRLWWFRRGETDFGIKPIPAGAYVKIIGMSNLEEVAPEDEARSYRAQGTFKRLAVVLAGPAANILIAFVLLVGVFMLAGRPDPSQWSVAEIVPGSSAEQAGLQPGDRVLAVAGEPIEEFTQLKEVLAPWVGTDVEIEVLRDGETKVLPLTVGWRLNAASAAAIPSDPPLEDGDRVLKLDGEPVTSYEALADRLATGEPATLEIEKGLHAYRLDLTGAVQLPPREEGTAGFLGVASEVGVTHETFVGAVAETARVMGNVVARTGEAFGRFATPSGIRDYGEMVVTATDEEAPSTAPGTLQPLGDSPSAQVSSEDRPVSIVGIVHIGGQVAETGWVDFLGLLAIVNLSLALINLLPLPPLDGGHAAVAAYEGVMGRIRRNRAYRVDMARLMPVVYVVILLMVGLGLTTIWLDIMNPADFSR